MVSGDNSLVKCISANLPNVLDENRRSISGAVGHRVKVLHASSTSEGGFWIADQVNELRARGIEAEVSIPDEGSLSALLDSYNIPWRQHEVPQSYILEQIPGFIRNIFSLVRFFQSERFDIVQSHFFPANLYIRIAAWIADVPVRLSMIPSNILMEAPFTALIERTTARMDTRIICACRYTSELYRSVGIRSEKLELIPYGIDEKRFDPAIIDGENHRRALLEQFELPYSSKLVGLVAYFYPAYPPLDSIPAYLHGRAPNNHEMLLKAIPAIIKEEPNARFILVGGSWGEEGQKYFEHVQKIVQDSNLQDLVKFTGTRSDLPELLSTFDVTVQCSLNENLAEITEALLMKRPMVASKVVGMNDTIVDERTGLLVPSEDHQAMAAAVVRLLQNPEFSTRLADAGRQLMLSKFSLAASTDDTVALYNKLLLEHASKGYRPAVMRFRSVFVFPLLLILAVAFSRKNLSAELKGRLLSYRMILGIKIANARLRLRQFAALSRPQISTRSAVDETVTGNLKQLVSTFWTFRSAISMLISNNLQQRYRGSVLGFCWGLLSPLMTMGILTIVFSTVFHAKIHEYAAYIFSGLLPWIFINDSNLQGCFALINAEPYIKKLAIPKILFPTASVLTDSINFMLSLLSFLVLGLLVGFKLNVSFLAVGVLVLTLTIFNLGLVLLSSVATVYSRDLPHILKVVYAAMFYCAPIIYPIDSIPADSRWIFWLNPFNWFIQAFRSAIYEGRMPSRTEWLITSTLSLLTLFAGLQALRLKDRDIVYRL